MARIAIVGPGAIGGAVAGWLIAAGHDVRLCARTAFERLIIAHPGGAIENDVAVFTEPAAVDPVDIVIVATKTYDSEAARLWLSRLVGPQTLVAIFQNGVEHRERFAGVADPDRLAPAVVDLPAERTAPGRIVQRRYGSITLADDDAGRAIADLFAATPIDATVTADFLTAAWRKLALNCAGIVNALLLRPADIAHDPAAAAAMRMLAAECVAVGRAIGADLPPDLPDRIIDNYRAAAPDSINSLHADRLAGRPTEVDARNGVIVRVGRRQGLDAPANALAVALLRAATGT